MDRAAGLSCNRLIFAVRASLGSLARSSHIKARLNALVSKKETTLITLQERLGFLWSYLATV